MPTTTELEGWIEAKRAQTRQLPNGWSIDGYGYTLCGFGQHRDSDALAQSNYSVAMRTLLEAAPMAPADVAFLGQPWHSDTSDEEQADRDAVTVGSFGHWAVGWIEELLVRTDRVDLLTIAHELSTYVEEQYPILDEMDFSEREWAANHPDGDTLCYSEDDDCGCDRERA